MTESLNEYIKLEEVAAILNIEPDYRTIWYIVKKLGIEISKLDLGEGITCCVKKTEIIHVKNSIVSFFNKYCLTSESELPNHVMSRRINKVEIPSGYAKAYTCMIGRSELLVTGKYAYLREDVKTMEQVYFTPAKGKKKPVRVTLSDKLLNIKETHVGKGEACNLLDCRYNAFELLRNDFDFDEKKVGRTIYYSKSVIDKILNLRKDFLNEYIDTTTIKNKYVKDQGSDHRVITKHLKKYPAPTYALNSKNTIAIRAAEGVYKISDVEEYIKSKKTSGDKLTNNELTFSKVTSSDINGADYMDTYYTRLNFFHGFNGFTLKNKYTEARWNTFVDDTLKRSSCKEHVFSAKINTYIKATLLINELLVKNDKSEVYMLTSSEINLFLKGVNVLSHKKILYEFLKQVYKEFNEDDSKKKTRYKFSLIDKPPRNHPTPQKKNNSDTIYDFDVYADIFKYQMEVKSHTERAIKEITNNNTYSYASTWLYVMLHLNNAWRHGDVNDFPIINIDEILERNSINDLNWFNDNEVTIPLARGVISRIIQWEFVISKTKMKGHFFCSDELAVPLATAIIILTLCAKNEGKSEEGRLLEFYSKNGQIKDVQLKTFFKELKLKGFVFKSKKFNKTVMTYITYLANLSGDNKALEYVKWMRSHSSMANTIKYIDFNIEAVESLSAMLFMRGEFGYASSMLLSKLNGGNVSGFEEQTKQIFRMNHMFGEISKMNNTVGMLNSIRADRNEIIKFLSEKSFTECQELLTDLYAKKLPSVMGSDVQCLCSKTGCRRIEILNEKDKWSCFDCPYHIPTIYALASLCDGIRYDLKMYRQSTMPIIKRKYELKIHRKKLILSDAARKLGSEYVFNCLGITRQEYIDMLSEINNPLALPES